MNQSLRLKHFYVRNKPGLILAAAFLLYFWAVLLPPPRNTLAAGSGILVTWILSGILINVSPFVAALALLYLVFRFSTTYYYANAPVIPLRILIIGIIGCAMLAFTFIRHDLVLSFIRRNHLLVFSITSIIFSALLAVGLFIGGDPEEFMDGFKTFPTLSPLMCFAAPATWKDTLVKFGLSTIDMRIPTTLLLISGFLFIFSVILFWIGKSRKEKTFDSPKASGLFGPDGFLIKESRKKRESFFLTSAILTFIGLPIFFTAVLELARYMIR
jgi:hypothetical protein